MPNFSYYCIPLYTGRWMATLTHSTSTISCSFIKLILATKFYSESSLFCRTQFYQSLFINIGYAMLL